MAVHAHLLLLQPELGNKKNTRSTTMPAAVASSLHDLLFSMQVHSMVARAPLLLCFQNIIPSFAFACNLCCHAFVMNPYVLESLHLKYKSAFRYVTNFQVLYWSKIQQSFIASIK